MIPLRGLERSASAGVENLGPPAPPDLWSLGTPKEEVMNKPIVIATGVIIALGATSAGVAAAKLTDPQIAHIVVTADDLDIANAKQALQKSQNEEEQRYANRMIAEHGSSTETAVAMAKKLKITPEDNPTSKSLKDAQDANRTKLDPSAALPSTRHMPIMKLRITRAWMMP